MKTNEVKWTWKMSANGSLTIRTLKFLRKKEFEIGCGYFDVL